MRLKDRLDTLDCRLPLAPSDPEEEINRAVFARERHEQEAAFAAAPPFDLDAYNREFERLIREEPTFWEEFERDFMARLEEEDREQGPWLVVPGHGRIRARTYARLRAAVTGGHDAAHDTP